MMMRMTRKRMKIKKERKMKITRKQMIMVKKKIHKMNWIWIGTMEKIQVNKIQEYLCNYKLNQLKIYLQGVKLLINLLTTIVKITWIPKILRITIELVKIQLQPKTISITVKTQVNVFKRDPKWASWSQVIVSYHCLKSASTVVPIWFFLLWLSRTFGLSWISLC